jgi:serine/threonine protein kinase
LVREFDKTLRAKADREMRGVLPAGTRVGRYQIVSVLGRGSFGVTYRACDTAADRDMAIKEFFPASLALREQDKTVLPISTEVAEEFVWWRDRFVEEQRILARLSGTPAVVRVYDLVEAHSTA